MLRVFGLFGDEDLGFGGGAVSGDGTGQAQLTNILNVLSRFRDEVPLMEPIFCSSRIILGPIGSPT